MAHLDLTGLRDGRTYPWPSIASKVDSARSAGSHACRGVGGPESPSGPLARSCATAPGAFRLSTSGAFARIYVVSFSGALKGSGDGRADRAVCTVITRSHLARARVLTESFHRWQPDVPVFVLVVDPVHGAIDPAHEAFHVVRMEDLGIPRLHEYRFMYPASGVCFASKAFFLRHLLQRGIGKLLYLDSDIWVAGDLAPLYERLDRATLLLTPHMTDARSANAWVTPESLVEYSGCYNAGFIGVRACPDTDHALAWWADRVYPTQEIRSWEAAALEQRWLDLLPCLVDGVEIVRDPGCNIAFWNVHERQIEASEAGLHVNGRPALFFHFAGYDSARPEMLSQHIPQVFTRELGVFGETLAAYGTSLLAHGQATCSKWPYAHGFFDNGAKIPAVARVLYRALGRERSRFGNPFAVEGPNSFFTWLNETVSQPTEGALRLSRLWLETFRQRPDLQAAFPDVFAADRERYLAWAATVGTAFGALCPTTSPAAAGPAEPPSEATLLSPAELSRQSLATAVQTRTAWAERMAAEVEQRDAVIGELQKVVGDRTARAERLLAEAEQRGAVIAELQEALTDRTAWAERLLAEAEQRGAVIAELDAALQLRVAQPSLNEPVEAGRKGSLGTRLVSRLRRATNAGRPSQPGKVGG
jgi:hypothetical protein